MGGGGVQMLCDHELTLCFVGLNGRKLKAKQQNQQNTQQPYWKVQSRA